MEFFNNECKGMILGSGKGEYKVIGKLKTASSSNRLMYLAPNPPNSVIL